jgi:hypothetical protein
MKSLADIFRDGLHPHADGELPSSGGHGGKQESPYLLLGQKPGAPPKPATAHAAQNPSEQEMRDYLASLAKAYDLPADFVQAAAMTESTFDPHKAHHNPARRAKNGRSIPPTIDYGLMQINSSKIGKESVEDPQGNKFRIGADVRTDWKANARAGVAILKKQYELAKLEQGAVTSEQDRAQQAYSRYNGGTGNRDRYLHERRDGLPNDKNDRHFLDNYLEERRRRYCTD